MTTPENTADHNAVLQEEAFIWLGRLSDGKVTRSELQAFKRWYATSPAHQSAFEDAKRQWKAMQPALTNLLRIRPDKAARHARMMRREKTDTGRRAFLGVAATAAAVAIVYPPLDMWPAPGEWGADFRTTTGEQRTVSLRERVSVTLNTQTSVRRQTADNGETIGLNVITGEAAIDLSSMAPAFSVIAGAGRSIADTGRFEVRHLNDEVCVTCVEGEVRVEHPAGNRLLKSSQRTTYQKNHIGAIQYIDMESLSAWRKGELVFNQTPLSQVVDEINRYRPGHVVLLSSAGGARPVVGRFRIEILNEALLQLQTAFGLKTRALPGGVLILS